MTGRSAPLDGPTSRRQFFRVGGATLGLGALVAACSESEAAEETPGRVGFAPPPEELEDYAVNDVVFLRTASSVEWTAVAVYDAALESGTLDAEQTSLFELLRESHVELAESFGELTDAAGGEAWECTNPWYMERSVEPMLAVVAESDEPARDFMTLAISFENLTASTNQLFINSYVESDLRVASIEASTLESRQSAVVAVEVGGPDSYVSPINFGEDPVPVNGLQPQYAITTQFGSVEQIQVTIGAPDENGARESFTLETPAENSYVYEEYGTECA